MTSLEQAKALAEALGTWGEHGKAIAVPIIQKHMEAFASKQVEKIELAYQEQWHEIASLREANRGLVKDKEIVDWLETNLHNCAIGHPTHEDGSWWVFFNDETHDLSGATLRAVVNKAINPPASLPSINLTFNEKKLFLSGDSKVCDIRVKLPPECAGYSIYREKSPMPDEQLTDLMPVFDGDKLYSIPPTFGA